MEGSEPSLVPEWLRNTARGNNFASSQRDDPRSSLPKGNKASKSISNTNTLYYSFSDRNYSTNFRRSLNSNGCGKHDNNSYSRSYSYSARNQPNKNKERLGIPDTWDYGYSDSLKCIAGGRIEKDAVRRSQSVISRRPNELLQRKVFADLRNSDHNINVIGNGAISVDRGTTSIRKVSLERDFPLLGSDERPITPDIVRFPSSRLSRGVQGFSIGTSPLVGSKGRTSALVEVPMGVGSNSSLSSTASQPSPIAVGAAVTGPLYASGAVASNGLNMAEALVKVPASDNGPQSLKTQRSKELPFEVSKRLIPLTPSMPKTLVHSPADKLKPKTALRRIDAGGVPKNGFQQMSSLQLGSQSTRNISARGDGSKSSATRNMLLLKPARENGVSPPLKNAPSQAINVTSIIANGSSTAASSVASIPLKNPEKAKFSTTGCRTSGYGPSVVSMVDKPPSLAQLQSRNDFFNLMRKKSMGGTSSTGLNIDCVVVSSGDCNSDELKKLASGAVSTTENGSDTNCDDETCGLAQSFSDHKESDLSEDAVIYSNEEEKAFLRSLGWEENTGDDEGLTEEEINSFCQKYMEWIPASKLL